MNDLKGITLEVCRIAKEIAGFLKEERKVFSSEKVELKQDHDYVSYVDKTAEKKLVEKLAALVPEAGFITEEGTVALSQTTLKWVIDPLDGTTNFIQDNAPYCISIALKENEDFLAGVVYEVCSGECYYAWKGGGAYMNDRKISVSGKGFGHALIGLDLPYNAAEYKPTLLNAFDKLYGNVAGIRINGSAAMGLCYVAIGRYDGWAEAHISPWDYSAGVLIVREAGGLVTDFNGSESFPDTHHIIATNGIIHHELRNILLIPRK